MFYLYTFSITNVTFIGKNLRIMKLGDYIFAKKCVNERSVFDFVLCLQVYADDHWYHKGKIYPKLTFY